MKNRILILLLLSLLFAPSLMAQRRSRGFWHQEWTVDKGDTIPLVHILPIRKYARKPDMRRYARMIRIVKKVYPLAKQARMEMEQMERELLAVRIKRSRKSSQNSYKSDLSSNIRPYNLPRAAHNSHIYCFRSYLWVLLSLKTRLR